MYNRLRSRRIGLVLMNVMKLDWDVSVREAMGAENIPFDWENTNLIGINYDMCNDCFTIYITHPDIPEVPEGEACPKIPISSISFSCEVISERYPFLLKSMFNRKLRKIDVPD